VGETQWQSDGTNSAAPRQRSIFWPVVGALLFVFVFLPIIMFVGCAACGVALSTS